MHEIFHSSITKGKTQENNALGLCKKMNWEPSCKDLKTPQSSIFTNRKIYIGWKREQGFCYLDAAYIISPQKDAAIIDMNTLTWLSS